MKRRKLLQGAAKPNVTPLCDIMLSLLIFFMLVSKAGVSDGSDMSLDLPAATQGNKLQRSNIRSLTLNIYPDPLNRQNPTVTLLDPKDNERATFAVRNDQTGTKPLLDFLKAWTPSNPELRSETHLLLRTARTTPYSDIEPILVYASEAGVGKVNYAVDVPKTAVGGQ